MESNFIPQRTSKTVTFLSWILIALAILSCNSRADYNVVIGFLILFLRSQYANKSFIKAAIHILTISLFFDIIWIWQYTSYWKHGEEEHSDLWNSLSFVHNVAYYLGICELLLKFPILLFLFKQFKGSGGQNTELLSLNYMPSKL